MISLPPIPDISTAQGRLHKVRGLRESVVRRLGSVVAEIKHLEEEDEVLDQVAALLRSLIDKEVTAGVSAVEKLQTEGLQAVFDDQDLQVKANLTIQRGKVSVELRTIQTHSDGTVTEGVSSDAFGGAVLTAQSVLMRIIVMLRRGMRPLLLLDETLPALDSNYASNMGSFLSMLCDRLDLDILLVTHNPVLVDAAQRAYRIVKKDGSARFQKIKSQMSSTEGTEA